MLKKLLFFFFSIFILSSPAIINSTNAGALDSAGFKVDTSAFGMGGEKITGGNDGVSAVKYGLSIIVTKLLISLGVIALLIMTIGGGYMIFSGGKDELLNKGKSIFVSGIIALIVALASGIIMKAVIYMLY